jgi:hypothetical protein
VRTRRRIARALLEAEAADALSGTKSKRTHTVTVRFQGGERAYWLTDQVFAVGDTVMGNGRSWVVSDVLENERDGHLTIRLLSP